MPLSPRSRLFKAAFVTSFAACLAVSLSACAGIVGIHDLSDDEDAAADDDASTTADAAAAPDSAAVPDSSAVDTGVAPACNAATCPLPGTCNKNVCTFNCGNALVCVPQVKCPVGIECDVTCNGGACENGIDCSQASKCVLKCQNQSCNGSVISCDGQGSSLECDKTSCADGMSVGTGCTVKP